MNDLIKITGAKEHNLKNISLNIPKNRLVVFTGLSGSGKSTLAFDTLYAEGQRRYIESLSSYARQFLDRVGKPDVEKIEGLTPAIAIDQKSTSKNPRSTVGTITEIYDYLRLLYARIGVQHCPKCGEPVSKMSASDIINQIAKLPHGAKITVLAPLVREKKGTFADILENLSNKGFVRAQIDGVLVRLDEEIELSKTKKHTIKAVIDRLIISPDNTQRLSEAVEKSLDLSFGEVEIDIANLDELNAASNGTVSESAASDTPKNSDSDSAKTTPNCQNLDLKSHLHFSEHNACFKCKISFNALEPLAFSFNSPKGACDACDGLGIRFSLDTAKIINHDQSIEGGAVKVMYGFNKSYYYKFLMAFCEQNAIPVGVPYGDLSEEHQRLILYGNAKQISFLWKRTRLNRTFDGVLKIAYDILKDDKDFGDFTTEKTCEKCGGNRLNADSLAVRVAGRGLGEIINLSIEDAVKFFSDNKNFSYLSEQNSFIAAPILKEINERLFFLYDVGLGYLTLGRDARTISGGEAQRIRIASQIGSGLSGVMYVLDEPSIGLHERDTLKLIKTLRSLQQKGNSVIVVEHDKKTIEAADFIVDIGPGAGLGGGEVVYAGDFKKMLKTSTITAAYLNGKKKIDYYKGRAQEKWIEISGVSINNIKNLNARFPLQNLVGVTGVSGSGKSSLVLQTLLPTALGELNRAKKVRTLKGAKIEGLDQLDKVIYLDQSPIGRTPRSNPATYTGVMDEIRALFASTKEAKIRGYKIGRFSFNVKGGRCEKCGGEGEITVEMHFLPDINVICDACRGTRYNAQTLEVKYKGKNIAEVLNMSISEALEFFKSVPKIAAKLKTLDAVGLGYATLGQSATTLSGGEAQRIKLSKELGRSDTGATLYILDEPTTGLHFADVDRLTAVLHHLVELGNSVIVIEHNLDVIKNCDYIVDMGPEGGSGGGKIIASGSPVELAQNHAKTGSFTGAFLVEELAQMGKNIAQKAAKKPASDSAKKPAAGAAKTPKKSSKPSK